jgi:lipopolysaccharide/colanic/teichoic acid biosynthesis glycosyltransferase
LSFKLVPSHLDVIIGKSGIDQVTQVPLLEIENRLLQFWPALAKRFFDIMWAGIFAVIFAPFFLLVWLSLACIRMGKLQARTVITPRHGALRLWQLSRGGRLAKWPWLLAILSGKLSWVGVAIPPLEATLKPPEIDLPFGVTDVAKINRHAQLSQEEKNKLYLYYVTHYSPLLDLEILLRTLFRI